MPAEGKPSRPAKPLERPIKPGMSLYVPLLAAAATAIVVLVAALIAALLVRDHLLTVARANFDSRAAHVTSDVRRELLLCSELLRGASGLVVAQGQAPGESTPSPDAWDRYISRLNLDDSPPCVRTLGYAAAYGPGLGSSGAGASGKREPSALARIVLMWPPSADTPGGREIGVAADTRAALLRAANTGQVALIIRPLPRESANEPGFSEGVSHARVDLYLPIYRVAPPPVLVPARRDSLIGFALARLDTEYLFASIAAQAPLMDIRVMGGTSPIMLYPPGAANGNHANGNQDARTAPPFQRSDTLRFGGETLTLRYTAKDPHLVEPANFSGGAIIAVGFVGAVLAAAAVYIFLRKRGITLAEAGVARMQATRDEARLMAIIRSSSEAIVTIDEHQRIIMFNPAAEKVFRCSAMEAIGSSIDRFIPERFRLAHRKDVQRFGETAVNERRMGLQEQLPLVGLRADGEEFPIEASISQILDGNGKLYNVMLRDITERVRAESELKASRQELRELSSNLQNLREEEKTRIARELHDDLGQQLTALKMDLSSVEQSLVDVPSAPEPVLEQLHGMRRLIDSTVGSVRRIAADLRPVMLDDLGLMPAIDWLLTDFTTRYGTEIERRIDVGHTEFSRNGATAVFRIIQEALMNVAKHADATRITLELAIANDQCRVSVEDNGHGAPGLAVHEGGQGEKSFGILGIRERVHVLGGTVSIETAVDEGFKLTAWIPLAAIQQEEALP